MRARLVSLSCLSALALLLAACGSQPPAPEQNRRASSRARRGGQGRQHSVTRVQPDTFDPASIAALKDPRSPLSKRSVYFD